MMSNRRKQETRAVLNIGIDNVTCFHDDDAWWPEYAATYGALDFFGMVSIDISRRTTLGQGHQIEHGDVQGVTEIFGDGFFP
jgi:hypothetical protein